MRMLKDAGYADVTLATETQEALKIMLTNQFDLLLVDWVMPGHSGLELVKRVRAGVKHRHTPIVMVTGQDEQDQVTEAIDAGINGYLLKPPQRDKLLAVMQRFGL